MRTDFTILWGLLLSLVLPNQLFGQKMVPTPHQVDSFQQIVLHTTNDTTRYIALYALAEGLATLHLDSAKMYARQLIDLTDQMGEQHRQARAWRVLGGVFLDAGLVDSIVYPARQAIQRTEGCLEEACQIELLYATKLLRIPLRANGDIQGIINVLESLLERQDLSRWLHFEVRRLLSFPLMEMGKYHQALEHLSLVWNYSQGVGDQTMMCNLLGELTVAHNFVGNTEKALALAKQRREICRAINNDIQVMHTIHQIASYFSELGQPDSAGHYYQELLDEGIDSGDLRTQTYGTCGLLLNAIDLNLATATDLARKVLLLLQEEPIVNGSDFELKQRLFYTLSKYYLFKKRYDLAKAYAQKNLDQVRQFAGDTVEIVVNALNELAQIQAASGDYQTAWLTYDTFHQLKMAMVRRNQEEALAQTAVEMDLAENQLARSRAEEATHLERRVSTIRTRFFLGILAVAMLILGVFAWAYRRAQQDKQQIAEKNALVEQSLAEKEVLLREIHHRVKNNLQIISSLLDKQARKSSDALVRKLVKEGQERIQSMALIHQNLYESDQLSGIDIKSYLLELGENIQKSQTVSAEQIQLKLDVADEKLDIDTAIPVGLILNELLTNCYKYAFPQEQKGIIQVAFQKRASGYYLEVRDDGVGFEPNQNNHKSKSLGLNLVIGLVRQLEGTIEWLTVERGAAVAIRI